jgi:lipoprotein-anchoring transpeptidase ErfK/SrfK
MKDIVFLKEYVQLHPENKMGWYLLGKEYEKNGEEGKANYCFNQSSEVYEAFENSRVPDDIWQEYEDRIVEISHEKSRRIYKIRVSLFALVIMLLVMMPSIYAPGNAVVTTPDEIVNSESSRANPIFTAQLHGSTLDRAGSLALMLAHPRTLPTSIAVLGMESEGKWLVWKHSMPISYTLEKTTEAQVIYQSYDPVECDCTPLEDSRLNESATLWVKKQEELVALSGAISYFLQKEGRVPESFNELSQPFPRNSISGSTEIIRKYFDEIKDIYAATISEGSSVENSHNENSLSTLELGLSPTASASSVRDGIGDEIFFKQPLEVIIDKENHRLAVVSGHIMLRNYKVGLGGDKTPENEFVITEKVVNPNRKSNGEFGSRGMQLSESKYAIHGTDEPDSIGRDESNGCIRMGKEDIEELFDLIPMGTKVRIEKGVLPDDVLVPNDRYQSQHRQDQTNPLKTYHWLN